MRRVFARHVAGGLVVLGVCGTMVTASAQTRIIRVVSYNILADSGTYTTAHPGLVTPSSGGTVTNGGVLEGIGEEILGSDPAQPIDILALQETTSNSTTVQPIVNGLNVFYSFRSIPAGYAMSSYQATESGGSPSTGNGPNALVYNTNTLQLVASVPVDPPGGTSQLGSASGMYREVMRYEFAPAGVTATTNNEFYIYVSHYKASTGTQNAAYRLGEATIIRNDESSLPANARVLYVGDYNPDNNSSEPGYQTICSNSAPNGVKQGQGVDPLNILWGPYTSASTTINWSSSTTSTSILFMLSDASTGLKYRDDLQVMTSNVYYDVAGGLAYVPGTYHSFGNNGSFTYGSSVNNGSNTGLNDLDPTKTNILSAAQLLQDLTTASDHLPVVADYTIPISSSSLAASFTASPTNGVVPLNVTFTDASSGAPTSWSWSFGDSGTSTLQNPNHTYTTPGVYSVTLIASNAGGSGTNTQANLITVLDPFTAWQLQYFGCTNCPQALPNADPLGKGMSNTNQYLVGLDATNPASLFRILSAMPQSNDMLITWTYGPGKTNALQETAGTSDGSYETNDFTDVVIITNTVGTITNYLDLGAATNQPALYYRVRLVP